MTNTKWKENNTLRLREFVPENTIKEDVLLEDDYFRFYIISGRKFDTYGGIDYGKGEYRVDSKGYVKDNGIRIYPNAEYGEVSIGIYAGTSSRPSNTLLYVKSPKKFMKAFEEAVSFAKKIAEKMYWSFVE